MSITNTIKQMMDIRPGNGISRAQSNEHKRDWTEEGWKSATGTGNYDRSRTHLNFEIAKGGKIVPVDKSKSIDLLMAENLMARGIKDPNIPPGKRQYRTVANFIFGGNRERMRELAFGNQQVDWKHDADNSGITRMPDIELWAKDIYQFVSDKWGEENIVSFCVHLDEMNPHVHCTLLPIDKDNKFAFKKLFAGKDKYEFRSRTTALHDELATVNAKWGLERGDSIAVTGARHRSTEEYRRELSRECTSLEEQIESDKSALENVRHELWLAEKRVKGLTTMISNLEERKASLEQQMMELSGKIKSGKGNVDDLHRQIASLDMELQNVIDDLADKTEKRDAAAHTLETLINQRDEMLRNTEETKKALHTATATLQQQVKYRLSDASLELITEKFNEIYPQLDTKTREFFEDSLLNDLAERGNDIFKCAILLYANYVDMATQFAKTHGGGGSTSQSPWGRKDDEDDRAWARRCMIQAHKMIRPASRKIYR